jgi:hypothetical protein
MVDYKNTFNKKQYLKREDSKDSLRTFTFSTSTATIYPDFNFATILYMIDNDPVARGAMTAFVDAFMEGDYAILKKEDKSYDEQFEKRLDDEFNFRHEVIRKFAISGKLSKNVFLEIVRAPVSGEVKALNILDSLNIEVITKPNGDVLKYVSKMRDPLNGKAPEWNKDEIVWYKLEDRSAGYATADMKALWENLQIKAWVKRLVGWLFKTGQYRVLYNFKSASDKDVEDTLAYMRRNSEDFSAPLFIKGEMETQLVRDMKEVDNIANFLKWLDSQTLVLMRVPPIDAGIPDASGRSNADAQNNSFSAHLNSFKKVFEDVTNKELFPLLNKGNSIIRFAPNNRFEEAQIIDNLVKLRGIMVSEELIREYLQDRGMFFGTEKLFEEPVMEEGAMGGPQKQADSAPSRQKSSTPKKKGTGEAGSTRPDQMKQ